MMQEQLTEFKTRHAAGQTYREIASHFGMSGPSAAHRVARRLGLESRDGRRCHVLWNDARVDLLQEMISSGAAWSSIAQIFELTIGAAMATASTYGLERNRGDRFQLDADELHVYRRKLAEIDGMRQVAPTTDRSNNLTIAG